MGVGDVGGGLDDEEGGVVGSLEEGDEAGGVYTEEVDCVGSSVVVSATVLEYVVGKGSVADWTDEEEVVELVGEGCGVATGPVGEEGGP